MKNRKLIIGIITTIVLSWCNQANAQEATIDSTSGRTVFYTRLMARSYGDSIVLRGKGHETYQIIGKNRIHYDEREIVKTAVEKLK